MINIIVRTRVNKKKKKKMLLSDIDFTYYVYV